MKPIPIFYDDSSSKSILTWWQKSEYVKDGPIPIIKLLEEADLKEVHFVSNNFRSFVTAYKICEKAGISLRFGLEIIVTDLLEKSENSQINESKVIIWSKNSDGYKDLIKIYSKIHSSSENKYYYYRGSWDMLKALWTKNLILSFPWADSFISNNRLKHKASIVPDLSFTDSIVFFREVEPELPFADLIDESIDLYTSSNKLEVLDCKTIYYNNPEDVKACMIFRSIFIDKASFFDPKLSYFCSNSFSFKKWKELAK